jgi:MYXO-CTERM domain-containing protein
MKKLLRIAALVAATTLAARAAAATTPVYPPLGSCLLTGGFSPCADITSPLSPFGFFVLPADARGMSFRAGAAEKATGHSDAGGVLPGEGDDSPIEGFLTSAEAVGPNPFGHAASGVFVSSLGRLKGKHKDGGTRKPDGEFSSGKCRNEARSHADHALAASLCDAPLPADINVSQPADIADVVTPEPPAMLLMAMGLLGMAGLELWRRSKR